MCHQTLGIICIRNRPAENHKGSQWLSDSHGTKGNLKPHTNNFSNVPKIDCNIASCLMFWLFVPYSCVESVVNKKVSKLILI